MLFALIALWTMLVAVLYDRIVPAVMNVSI
jgi:hypothetical protein